MATGRKRWMMALLLGLLAAGWLGWRMRGRGQGTERLVNQVWLERVPRDQRDQVRYLLVLELEGQRLGVAARASRWRSLQEGFVWSLEGNWLRTRFPQNDRRLRVQVRTWECAGEAPRGFELCLEVRRAGRATRFYSRKNWVIRPRAELPAELAWLPPVPGPGPASRSPVPPPGDEPDTPDADLGPLDAVD